MMSGFTPGPWHNDDMELCSRIRSDAYEVPVGFVEQFMTGIGPGEAERKANARLISACPDMAAVCLELDRLCLVIESAVRNADPGNREPVLALIRANRAAISKASNSKEGEG